MWFEFWVREGSRVNCGGKGGGVGFMIGLVAGVKGPGLMFLGFTYGFDVSLGNGSCYRAPV